MGTLALAITQTTKNPNHRIPAMAAADKNWAKAYVLDPLNEPEPSQETGLGTHFGNTLASNPKQTTSYAESTASQSTLGSNNPFRRSSDNGPKSSTGRNRASSDAGNRLQKTSGIEMEGGPVNDEGVQRSGSKRHSLDGLKRRIGSLRKKNSPPAA